MHYNVHSSALPMHTLECTSSHLAFLHTTHYKGSQAWSGCGPAGSGFPLTNPRVKDQEISGVTHNTFRLTRSVWGEPVCCCNSLAVGLWVCDGGLTRPVWLCKVYNKPACKKAHTHKKEGLQFQSGCGTWVHKLLLFGLPFPLPARVEGTKARSTLTPRAKQFKKQGVCTSKWSVQTYAAKRSAREASPPSAQTATLPSCTQHTTKAHRCGLAVGLRAQVFL